MRASLQFCTRALRAPQTTPWRLWRGSCPAQAPRAALVLLRSPLVASAAVHTRAGPSPHQINELIKDATRARELLGLHAQHGQSFDHVNLSTCWSRLGQMGGADRSWLRSDGGARLTALREQTRDMAKFDAQAVSNTAHAMAKLDLWGTAWECLWKELEGAALARSLNNFGPQELANTAWAFATAGHAAPSLFDAIGRESAGRVCEFKSQELSNTAWAFATAGHAAPALFDAIAVQAASHVRDFNPQNISNTAWAFATAGQAAPALFDAIGREAAGRVRDFKPQELSNAAWAFATAGHPAPALFDAIGKEAAGRVRELTPQALANTAWAFATAGHAERRSSTRLGPRLQGACASSTPRTWPTRHGPLPRRAIPRQRSSTRLGGRLQDGCASSTLRPWPTRRGRLQFWTIFRQSCRSSTSASPTIAMPSLTSLAWKLWANATSGACGT